MPLERKKTVGLIFNPHNIILLSLVSKAWNIAIISWEIEPNVHQNYMNKRKASGRTAWSHFLEICFWFCYQLPREVMESEYDSRNNIKFSVILAKILTLLCIITKY
jgi:ascorbate-specific PTS system EIIC-type component UlaA